MAQKDRFLRGAMILTFAGLMVKVIGSFNRILLSRLLGGEGIGLYQMAYPVYLLLLAISSAGIPIAISIVVSEYVAKKDYGNVNRVFSISIKLLTLVGLVLAGSLYLCAGWLTETGVLRDARAYYALVALTPAIFFATILASFRGFFQGHQLMTPPAVSQIVEQFVRVCTMIVLAYALLPRGLEYAAAGAAFGAVPGSVTGLVVLGYFYRKYRDKWVEDQSVDWTPESTLNLTKRLLILAIPVSLANVLVPVTSGVDMLLVPHRLVEAGLTIEQATAEFGYLAGMAQPLLMMATIPTLSMAASLVPAVAEAFTLGDVKEIQQKALVAMKFCCLITVPATIGMSTLAEPISVLLYGTAKAVPAIMHSGPAIWLLGMQQITTGILQGLGRTKLPMLHMLAGITAKVVAVWFLTNGLWGIAGAAWATNINFAIAAGLNIWVLRKQGIGFNWIEISKIVLASAIMGASANFAYGNLVEMLGRTAGCLLALLLAVVVYIILVPIMRIITQDELGQMPLLKKIFGRKA